MKGPICNCSFHDESCAKCTSSIPAEKHVTINCMIVKLKKLQFWFAFRFLALFPPLLFAWKVFYGNYFSVKCPCCQWHITFIKCLEKRQIHCKTHPKKDEKGNIKSDVEKGPNFKTAVICSKDSYDDYVDSPICLRDSDLLWCYVLSEIIGFGNYQKGLKWYHDMICLSCMHGHHRACSLSRRLNHIYIKTLRSHENKLIKLTTVYYFLEMNFKLVSCDSIFGVF